MDFSGFERTTKSMVRNTFASVGYPGVRRPTYQPASVLHLEDGKQTRMEWKTGFASLPQEQNPATAAEYVPGTKRKQPQCRTPTVNSNTPNR